VLQRIIDWGTRDWALKLTSLALAFLLWTTVRADAPGTWDTEIEVRVVNNDADWVVADAPTPNVVTAVFRGPMGELLRTASDRPYVIVPIDEVNDSSEVHVLRRNWVRMPPGTDNTEVSDFRPSTVRITFDRVSTRLIPLAVAVRGEPAEGFRLMGEPDIEPSAVRASGARRDLMRIDTIRLPPIDLRDRRTLDTIEVTIDTVGSGLIVSPRTVRVVVPIRPILDDGPAAAAAAGPQRPGG
jgi:YbbR domain-containing protein